MRARIAEHLTIHPLLPELSALLLHMLDTDCTQSDYRQDWTEAILTIQQALGATRSASLPFADAWTIMYAAISYLDHLQDGDPITDSCILALPPPQQYNAVFSYYVLAESLLSTIDATHIPPARLHRLRALWSSSLLRMASGQQRDLILQTAHPPHTAQDTLATYQDIAQWKTGATFALAFGGAAMLHSDDQVLIDTLLLLGEIYGTLLQYSDDLHDVGQTNDTLTLPQAIQQAFPLTPPDQQHVLWSLIYRSSLDRLIPLLHDLPESLRVCLQTVFITTFGPFPSMGAPDDH